MNRFFLLSLLLLSVSSFSADSTSYKSKLLSDPRTKAFRFLPARFPYGRASMTGQIELVAQNPFEKPLGVSMEWKPDSGIDWIFKPAIVPYSVIPPKEKKTFWFIYQAPFFTCEEKLHIMTVADSDTLNISITPFFQRELPVKKAAPSIKVDGRLDEPCWTGAMHRPENVFGNEMKDFDSVWVGFAYDSTNLYLGFAVYDPHPESLTVITPKEKRDALTPLEDCLRFYLCTAKDSASGTCQVLLSAGGAVKDGFVKKQGDIALSPDLSWNGVAAYSVVKSSRGYEGEAAIPWKAFSTEKASNVLFNFRSGSARFDKKGARHAFQEPFDTDPRWFAAGKPE